jgi:ABC-type Zn uptake system ZnuABC Zn-binding protein ZnuA
MKRFVFSLMVLMLVSLFVGCATTSEERKEEYDLRKNVGGSAFVGLPPVGAGDNWRSP